mmetsp:Transcript_28955/g.56659  ORF Transcript_28955/g.56659 Transcript_28955/m.56659 type:complete len:228 (+) Transcript_28955:62-745(+)
MHVSGSGSSLTFRAEGVLSLLIKAACRLRGHTSWFVNLRIYSGTPCPRSNPLVACQTVLTSAGTVPVRARERQIGSKKTEERKQGSQSTSRLPLTMQKGWSPAILKAGYVGMRGPSWNSSRALQAAWQGRRWISEGPPKGPVPTLTDEEEKKRNMLLARFGSWSNLVAHVDAQNVRKARETESSREWMETYQLKERRKRKHPIFYEGPSWRSWWFRYKGRPGHRGGG